MIRKFGTVDAPVEVVRRIFSDIEVWPQWMPAVQATRVLERSDNRIVAEIDRLLAIGKRTATFDFRFTPQGHHEHQISGPAKKWKADWQFKVGPENRGTLISCRLEFSLGIVGLLVSNSMIQRWIDRTFEETLRGIEKQARIVDMGNSAAEREGRTESPVSRIEIFTTPTGVELWIDDRKYLAYPAD